MARAKKDTEASDSSEEKSVGNTRHRLQHLEAGFHKEVSKYAKGLTLQEAASVLTWVSNQLENG